MIEFITTCPAHIFDGIAHCSCLIAAEKLIRRQSVGLLEQRHIPLQRKKFIYGIVLRADFPKLLGK
ncbi:MAG: hypothetical protein DWI57_11635 [Chloroflexi bacterium]|nr:MAG: hypothetical protein DWI57_11635 [Chloroflexota bacterium]